MSKFLHPRHAGLAFALCPIAMAIAQTSADGEQSVVVVGKQATYAESSTTKSMIRQVAPIGSVNQAINQLPGVNATEIDFYGTADWATSISLRGFNSGPSGQQIGTTIDGLPNSSSNYGGGSRANRYIDILNLARVTVSQGTADISSRTNESLGGTLNYVTDDPLLQQRVRVLFGQGDQNGSKYAVRYDTGEFLPGTSAYLSVSTARNNDYVDNFSPTTRDYLNAKVISELGGGYRLTGWLSVNKANESEGEPVSLEAFRSNPRRDALTSNWTGQPRYDEFYRTGWRALRDNTFAWVGLSNEEGAVAFDAKAYYHRQIGRGDWIPPYLVDITNDGAGSPHSELAGGTVYGGAPIGRIYYVNADGSSAALLPGCTDATDPGCYAPTAVPVMSYRHTHYELDRWGATADVKWTASFGGLNNVLRGGLWYERQDATTVRDWQRVLNASVGPAFDSNPYWVQYRREFGANEIMVYAENAVTSGPFTAKLGLKHFTLDRDFVLALGDFDPAAQPRTALRSSSDPLLHAGLSWQAPLPGLEVFAGYSQNYSAIPQDRMSSTQEELDVLKPETADSTELGVRYVQAGLSVSATLFDINFENRTVFVPESAAVTGIDYLSQNQGRYVNLGGVHSRGFELFGGYRFGKGYSVSAAYTFNDATYVSTGFDTLDASANIKPGAQLYGAPRQMLSLALDYGSEVLSWGVNTKVVGARPVDFAGTEVADRYVLTNAYLAASAGMLSPSLKHTEVRLNVNNLFDRTYVAGITGGAVYPAPPRTVFLSVTADF